MERIEVREGKAISFGYMFEPHELKYHKSWDWLMPVLNKIRSFDCEFDIEHIGVFEVSRGGNWRGKSISHYEFDLDITYNAVVEFIKQHNESTD